MSIGHPEKLCRETKARGYRREVKRQMRKALRRARRNLRATRLALCTLTEDYEPEPAKVGHHGWTE